MNYNELKEEVKRYIVARIPLIEIETNEKSRCIALLKDVSKEMNNVLKLHTMANGFTNISTGEAFNNEKLLMGALDYIAKDLQTAQNQIYVFL